MLLKILWEMHFEKREFLKFLSGELFFSLKRKFESLVLLLGATKCSFKKKEKAYLFPEIHFLRNHIPKNPVKKVTLARN